MSAVISAFVSCVSPIRLYAIPASGINTFVEMLFIVCCFCGLCSFVVIEFTFCLYCCGFSVWNYRSLTLPLSPSAFSPDSVVIISSSSFSSSHRPSGNFSIWDYHSLKLPCGLVRLLRILLSSSLGILWTLMLSFLLTCLTCT